MAKGKKLKIEDYPFLSDKIFEGIQEVNSREVEDPNFE